jgi:hypothetical protein
MGFFCNCKEMLTNETRIVLTEFMQESINSVDYICVNNKKLELTLNFLLDKNFSLFAEFDIGIERGVEMNYWLAIKDD